MIILVLLITVSLTIAVIFLLVFYWNMKSGQYDDTYTPSVRMLFDDMKPKPDNHAKDSEKSSPNDKDEARNKK